MNQYIGLDVRSRGAESAAQSGIRTIVPIADITAPSATFLVEILERAERAQGTELLAFGADESDRIGELLVSHGRVCLVALSSGQMTLGARLAQRYPETATLVRNALGVARSAGRPLGDVLSELGGIDSDRIREALLDQIAEGLCEIGRAAPAGLFESSLSASTRQLSSALAGFSPEKVYWRAMPLVLPPCEDAASRCFHELSRLAETAVLCGITSEGAVLPILAKGLEAGSVSGVVRLGEHIQQLAGPPALLAAEIKPSLSMMSAGDASLLLVTTPHQIAMLGDIARSRAGKALSMAHGIVAGAV